MLINKPRVLMFFFAFLKELNITPIHFSLDKKNHEFGNQTIEMHCFASENQTYKGIWLFGVESWKSLKGQENLLLKNVQVKTRVENVWFLSWRIFFVGKYGIQRTNEMAFNRTVPLRQFSIPRHQIWCAHSTVVQRMHACACKMPSIAKEIW